MREPLDREISWEPDRWFLSFQRRAGLGWVDRLPLGRFRHVTAFGLVEAAAVWIVVDVRRARTDVLAVPEGEADPVLGMLAPEGSVILALPPPQLPRPLPRAGFLCTTAMAHLVGVRSGALRPDTLLRDCLRAGATVIAGDIDEGRRHFRGAEAPPEAPGAAGADR